MWLYALVAGWGAPCVRSAAGLTLFAIARYFYRERRPLNLLAAIAIGFLLLDPDQLFDASFQLTFLAVAFLGAFAAPLIQATSGPLGRGLSELADIGRDLHLPPRVAQFRIEMRLLARDAALASRMPSASPRYWSPFRRASLFFFFEVAAVSAIVQARPGAAHGGLLPPRRHLRPFRQRLRRADDGRRRARRLRRCLHGLGVGRARSPAALLGISQRVVALARRHRAALAHSARRRCGWRSLSPPR